MEWLLANPQINSTFGSLGSFVDDVYLVSDDCLSNLEEIIGKLAVEDTSLRTFRRAIGFGQNVKNDIVPLLVHAKDSKILDPTIRLLVNLTVPAECLLPVDLVSKSEIGRHTIFELNKLLITSKEAFVDWKTTKAIIDYMKSILEKDSKLSIQNCDSINNCLLLLRNILHVPEGNTASETKPAHSTSFQNQILWNLFTQSVDKLLIYLMSCPQRAFWAVTMAQLVALMYKDQHISTLQKLLSFWFESTLSESSEDNESNTSPPQQCSGDSSPMLTSDPTSDSSDNGSAKMNTSISKDPGEAEQVTRMGTEFPTQIILARAIKSHQMYHQTMGTTCSAKHPSQPAPPHDPKAPLVTTNSPPGVEKHTVQPKHTTPATPQTGAPASKGDTSPKPLPSPPNTPSPAISCKSKDSTEDPKSPSSGQESTGPSPTTGNIKNQVSLSENSDCGYGTQAEKESISTSSNEDDGPNQKPLHQKPPPNQKQRFNAANKQRNPTTIQDKKELRRKKLVKRSKSNIITMKGLMHHVPTDDDISNILKEFTVDFLLKGYGFLVQELHAQLLSDLVQIDTSHFFWLVTYFLKFASQLELDMEHINSVLSFDIVSYLTYEGVMLCEQLEQLTRVAQNDIKPCLRRIHLVVTAIREFLQALETYKKSSHLSKEDRELLKTLQLQISSTDDLKCLFVLLLRCYNPSLQSKQYLQDLIVTNHSLLLLLDGVRDIPGANVTDMLSHIRQFATVEIMHQYGLMLEDFRENGAFVNDCIFTMMHHVGGDLGLINVLFQPNILKTFSLIWETEYEICDFIHMNQDWSDLIEYVIHKFINTPQPSPLTLTNTLPDLSSQLLSGNLMSTWTQEEKDSLQWYYVQCKQSKCMVADILRLFEENGNQQKTRISIIEQLWEQDIVTLSQYDELMKLENPDYERNVQTPGFSVASAKSDKMDEDNRPSSKAVDDIQVLRDRLLKENKGKLIVWLQKSLLDCCFVKLNLLSGTVVLMEPVPYHCILQKKSIPVVPWNLEQFNILSYQPFVLLLHKLGFHLPADARKMFVRIPEFWTADILYNIALKLGPLEKSIIKFDLKHLNMALSMEKQATKSDPPGFPIPDVGGGSVIVKPADIYGTIASGYTPDVTTNWLQVVMRNKTSPNGSSSKPTMEIPVSPQVIVSTGAALHPSTGKSGAGKSSSHAKLAHDLSIIVEAASNDELPAGEDDDDDELDRSDGPALAGHDVVSDCETASVASDLTRMYVSDEEDKHHDIVPQIL